MQSWKLVEKLKVLEAKEHAQLLYCAKNARISGEI